MTERLKQVLVLTALDRLEKPITVDNLAQRLSGDEGEVRELVRRLVERGKVGFDGKWVWRRRPGMISADLRQAGARWWTLEHFESMQVWKGAAESLGVEDMKWKDYLDDIASEAIEHAEALGL